MVAEQLISSIVTIATTIYQQVETTKANREQCKRLADRIKAMVNAITELGTRTNTRRYQEGLVMFRETLEKAGQLVSKYNSQYKIFEFVKANKYKDEFTEITEQLRQTIEQLNLVLSADELIKVEDEIEDRRRDHEALITMLIDIQNSQSQMSDMMKTLQCSQQDAQNAINKLLNLKIANCNNNIAKEPEDYYREGISLTQQQKYREALNQFMLADRQHYYQASTNIGTFFRRGFGVIGIDPAKAEEYYKKAADKGEGRAMLLLGEMYENGENGKKDLTQALGWYQQALQNFIEKKISSYVIDKLNAKIDLIKNQYLESNRTDNNNSKYSMLK